MPLRFAEVPRDHARAEAMSTADGTATHWGVPGLWQQLEPLLPGLSVEVVERVGSTNTALLDRSRATGLVASEPPDAQMRRSAPGGVFGRRAVDIQPCLLVAEHQSHGRGRQGRSWQSASGASLTFSISLLLQPADWSGLSLAVGVAVAEALAGPPGTPMIGVKWPNDLWLMDEPGAGRKLGGILIETVASGAQRLAVIGVGLNVLPLPIEGLSAGVASLQEVDPQASAPATLARIALPLVQALRTFERQGFGAFAARFAALDILAGRPVSTTRSDVPQGVARGVSAQGALQMETAGGMVSLVSGEVSVRPIGTLHTPDR